MSPRVIERWFLPVAALIAALALPGAGHAAPWLLRGFVVANGGQSSPPGSNTVYRLYSTAGQAAVGLGQSVFKVCSGYWCFGGPRTVAVDPPGSSTVPSEFALGPATPNPAHGGAHFVLTLPKAATVTLRVFDVAGREVGDPVSRELPAGERELYWRAPEDRAGVYFMWLTTDGSFRARRTIVLLR